MTLTDLAFSKLDDILPSGYAVVGSKSENIVGHWRNNNPASGLIQEVIIEKEGEDYIFHAFGKGKNALIDFGKSTCITYYSNIHADTVEGFTTTFDLNFMEVHLAANVKYGVLVLSIFNVFKDGSNRQNYYAREFYSRKATQVIEENIFSGIWKNTRTESEGIGGFEILQKEEGLFIRLEGVEGGTLPLDWGIAPVKSFAKSVDSKKAIGWSASFDLPAFKADLSININKGLVIIAAMIESRNPDQSNVFIREFFEKREV